MYEVSSPESTAVETTEPAAPAETPGGESNLLKAGEPGQGITTTAGDAARPEAPRPEQAPAEAQTDLRRLEPEESAGQTPTEQAAEQPEHPEQPPKVETDASAFKPEQMLHELHDHGVDMVIIGGYAMVLQGVDHLTRDIDMAYNPDPENVERLLEALQDLHAYRRAWGLSPEQARAQSAPITTEELAQREFLTLATDAGELDVHRGHVAGVGEWAAVLEQAEPIEVDGIRVYVLNIDALRASKLAAGRPKDMIAVEEIDAEIERRQAEQPASS